MVEHSSVLYSRQRSPRRALMAFGFVATAPLVAGSVWLGACAADSGDPSKGMPTTMIIPPPMADSTAPIDTGSNVDQGVYTNPDTRTGVPEATTTSEGGPEGGAPEGAPPAETGPAETGPMESGPADTGPVDTGHTPPPADGGGCSAGATVFTATDPGNVNTSGSYGDFNTTGPVCVKLLGGITSPYGGWGGNNVTGRTLMLNGAPSAATSGQGMVPASVDGYAVWEWSAGTDSYAGMDFY
jgi:hypothetical protein